MMNGTITTQVEKSIREMETETAYMTATGLGQWWPSEEEVDPEDLRDFRKAEEILKHRIATLSFQRREEIKAEMRGLVSSGADFFCEEVPMEERTKIVESIIGRLFPTEKAPRKYGPSPVVLQKTQEIARMACSV